MIAQKGEGNNLPALDALTFNAAIEPAEIPTSITVLGSPIVYQAIFKLLPAAKEYDGSIVPLDSVSYKPAGGWGLSKARAFRDTITPGFVANNGITYGTATQEEISALAASCVWKYFRFSSNDPYDNSRPITIPGLAQDAPGLQILTPYQLDFLDACVYSDPKDPKGKPYNLPVNVWGSVFKGAIPFFNPWKSNDLTIPTDVFRGIGFSIDNARKIIIADRHLYAVNSSDPSNPQAYAPTLYCKCSVNVRDQNGKLVRYSKNQPLTNLVNTRPQYVIREDIVLVRMAEFDTGSLTVKSQADNNEPCEIIANYYLTQEIKKLEPKPTQSQSFPGFIPIEPDGAIAQITWSVGNLTPATTTGSLNREHRFWCPTFEQRLFQQRIKAFIDRPIPFINRNSQNASGQGGVPINLGAGKGEGV
jgi:hypothetical protein